MRSAEMEVAGAGAAEIEAGTERGGGAVVGAEAGGELKGVHMYFSCTVSSKALSL